MAPIKFELQDVEGSGGGNPQVFLSVIVPRRFVWTVSFEGLDPKEDVGLELADPPLIGLSGNDFS